MHFKGGTCMKAPLKYGLIVGIAAMAIVIPVAAFLGMLGPAVILVAGGVAGTLSALFGRAPTRREGALSGSIAGLITGAIALLGQVSGTFLALFFVQNSGPLTIFGDTPMGDLPGYEGSFYLASRVIAGIFLGVVGMFLSTGAGALGGRLGTRTSYAPGKADPEKPR
jgi:hypothetical protein